MPVTSTLQLFVDSTETPPYYWLNVSLVDSEDYLLVSHGEIPSAPYSGDVMNVRVNLEESTVEPTDLLVQIGKTSLNSTTGTIVVHFLDENENEIDTKSVSMAQAQEQTRPIPSLDR